MHLESHMYPTEHWLKYHPARLQLEMQVKYICAITSKLRNSPCKYTAPYAWCCVMYLLIPFYFCFHFFNSLVGLENCILERGCLCHSKKIFQQVTHLHLCTSQMFNFSFRSVLSKSNRFISFFNLPLSLSAVVCTQQKRKH